MLNLVAKTHSVFDWLYKRKLKKNENYSSMSHYVRGTELRLDTGQKHIPSFTTSTTMSQFHENYNAGIFMLTWKYLKTALLFLYDKKTMK